MNPLSKLRQLVGRCLGRPSPSERFLRRLDFPATEVARTYRLLAEDGVGAWITGGWGVDAVAGRQTRPHRDLDFLVPIDQGDQARRILEGHGYDLYLPEVEFPYRVGMVNRRARLMVDLQLVMPQPDGSCTFRVIESEIPSYDYVYSAEGLAGRGTVAGVEVPCITLEEQVRARTEQSYSFENSDRVRAGGVLADVHDLAVAESLLDP
jgi:lincosamide nucleotidyltransferase A/C/D/E